MEKDSEDEFDEEINKVGDEEVDIEFDGEVGPDLVDDPDLNVDNGTNFEDVEDDDLEEFEKMGDNNIESRSDFFKTISSNIYEQVIHRECKKPIGLYLPLFDGENEKNAKGKINYAMIKASTSLDKKNCEEKYVFINEKYLDKIHDEFKEEFTIKGFGSPKELLRFFEELKENYENTEEIEQFSIYLGRFFPTINYTFDEFVNKLFDFEEEE